MDRGARFPAEIIEATSIHNLTCLSLLWRMKASSESSAFGEENLDVVESLRRSSIKLIVTRHEQAASFMAVTQGRLTGRPGVCLATLGPGALNLTTGAAYALLRAMSMVMITGQKGVLSCKQGRFQVVMARQTRWQPGQSGNPGTHARLVNSSVLSFD